LVPTSGCSASKPADTSGRARRRSSASYGKLGRSQVEALSRRAREELGELRRLPRLEAHGQDGLDARGISADRKSEGDAAARGDQLALQPRALELGRRNA
jgi:hypothetical protein